jgi:tripartite-type tricarboxylate transporter receptor subunit TctC
VNDFTPVTLFSDQPMVLEGRKDLPASNLAEFIALLKQSGKKMQYGSAGVGSTTHLACALLNARIGVDVTHVPYRGGGPAANDLIGGHIDYMCGNLGTSVTRVAARQSKALALLSRERTPLMPELATAHEQGISDYDVVTWTAFFLPKGAPKDIVARLNEATHAAMDTPEIKARFNAIGVVGVAPERRGPEYRQIFGGGDRALGRSDQGRRFAGGLMPASPLPAREGEESERLAKTARCPVPARRPDAGRARPSGSGGLSRRSRYR